MKNTLKKVLSLLLASLFLTGMLSSGLTSAAVTNYMKDFELLMYVDTFYGADGVTVVTGTVTFGEIKPNDRISIRTYDDETLEPVELAATVEYVSADGDKIDGAGAGDKVGIGLSSNITLTDIHKGDAIVCENSSYMVFGSAEGLHDYAVGVVECDSDEIDNYEYYSIDVGEPLCARMNFNYMNYSCMAVFAGDWSYGTVDNFEHPVTLYIGQKIDILSAGGDVIGWITITAVEGGIDSETGWENTMTFDFETREDFDAWTCVIENDTGLGWKWNKSDMPGIPASSGEGAAVSLSTATDRPDDWLISPAITLDPSKAVLTFDEASISGNRFTVYVGFYPDPDAMIPLYGMIDSWGFFSVEEGGTMQAFYSDEWCDLSAYAGKTVYIAFRHCDPFRITDDSPLGIDNVQIWQGTKNPFTDVPENSWFTNAVLWCYSNSLMNGTSGTAFSPNDSFTRAMFVTVLSRIDEADTSSYTGTSFSDVPEGEWFSKPIEWAYRNEFASGLGGGLFGPNSSVTREQLAQFLYNYSKKIGYIPGEFADLSRYPDADKVSPWAADAMKWAVGIGLISGIQNGDKVFLSPGGTATRAQVAVIIRNYLGWLDFSRNGEK